MYKKIIESERLLKENKSLIGKFVRIGRFCDGWVYVTDNWSAVYKLLPSELSEELYKDAYGTLDN